MSKALILMYHAVDDPKSSREQRYCCRPGEFRRQMSYLCDAGHVVVPLAKVTAALRERRPLRPGTVALTFDDGLECFLRNAYPVLKTYSFPATVFTVVGHLGGDNGWMRSTGWPARRLMRGHDLRSVQSSGITVGSHSTTHPRLPELDEGELLAEVLGARERLAELLGNEVAFFAYPYGAHAEREKQLVRQAGYEAACSTRSGFNNYETDLFSLHRIDVYGTDSLRQFRWKVRLGANRVSSMDLMHYYRGRLKQRLAVSA